MVDLGQKGGRNSTFFYWNKSVIKKITDSNPEIGDFLFKKQEKRQQ
jgi:hypothetical protein